MQHHSLFYAQINLKMIDFTQILNSLQLIFFVAVNLCQLIYLALLFPPQPSNCYQLRTFVWDAHLKIIRKKVLKSELISIPKFCVAVILYWTLWKKGSSMRLPPWRKMSHSEATLPPIIHSWGIQERDAGRKLGFYCRLEWSWLPIREFGQELTHDSLFHMAISNSVQFRLFLSLILFNFNLRQPLQKSKLNNINSIVTCAVIEKSIVVRGSSCSCRFSFALNDVIFL